MSWVTRYTFSKKFSLLKFGFFKFSILYEFKTYVGNWFSLLKKHGFVKGSNGKYWTYNAATVKVVGAM